MKFFWSIPGAIGLNAVVALASGLAFLVGYELLALLRFFGLVRSFQMFFGLTVVFVAVWVSSRLLRSVWQRLKTIKTANWTGF